MEEKKEKRYGLCSFRLFFSFNFWLNATSIQHVSTLRERNGCRDAVKTNNVTSHCSLLVQWYSSSHSSLASSGKIVITLSLLALFSVGAITIWSTTMKWKKKRYRQKIPATNENQNASKYKFTHTNGWKQFTRTRYATWTICLINVFIRAEMCPKRK